MKTNIIICLSFSLLIIFSCNKIGYFEGKDVQLRFSNDSIIFDTVFTKLGSATKILQIFNPYDQKLKLTNVRLAKGSNSQFRLNIDGVSAVSENDIEIAPKDSLWIFIQVTVNPLNINSPLVVKDSILFETNGVTQDVDLLAWGQDAVYYYPDSKIPGLPPYSIVKPTSGNDIRWTNEKPIVIFDYAVVDSATKLIVDAGAKIYFYTKNSGLWIYKDACIKVNGTKANPVIFQGGRLESDYREEPGQWDRIWINESNQQSEFNYVIIKNGFLGLQAEVLAQEKQDKLILNNVWIRNMTGWGLLARYFNIDATNTLITNCGKNVLALTLGGNYNFTHCTFANYWTVTNRKSAMIFMSDYAGSQLLKLNANFNNSIIYGDKENELETDFKGLDTLYKFENCLLKISPAKFNLSNTSQYLSCVFNTDPKFKNARGGDYHLTDGSSVIGKGSSVFVVNTATSDYDGILRSSSTPDIGAINK